MTLQADRSVRASVISKEQIAAFREDGAVLIKGLLDDRWLAQMAGVAERAREASDAEHAGMADEVDRSTLVIDDLFMADPEMRHFLEHSPVAGLAGVAMQSRFVRIYEDLLLYKSAVSMPTSWHQDEPQWPVTGPQLSSVWFSLEATTPETGSLQFVAGSHKGPLYIPYLPPDRQDDLEADMHFFTGGAMPDIDADPKRYQVIRFATEPGDAILFHPRTVHAAFGNHSARPRRTFTIRFMGEKVRWLPKKTAYHDWLRAIDLPEGSEPDHDRFPIFWREHSAIAS